MNLKLILRTYAAYRQMSPDDVALLETLRALSDGDRELLVESLGPQAGKKKSSKSSSSKQSTKSKRATSLSEKIQGTAGKPHVGEGPVCGICSHAEEYEDHFKPSPHYHPFQPPASTAAQGSAPASSGIDGDGVGDVHHAASSGD